MPHETAQNIVLVGWCGVVIEQAAQIFLVRRGELGRGNRFDRRRGAVLECSNARLDRGLAGTVFLERVHARLVGLSDALELLLLAGELPGEQRRAIVALQLLAVGRQDAEIQLPEVLFDLREHGAGQFVNLDAVRLRAAAACVVMALQRRPALAGRAALLPRQRRAAARALDQPLERKRLAVLAAVPPMPPLALVEQLLRLLVQLGRHQRLMPAVHDHRVRVIPHAARAAGRRPAHFADVDRVAQDIFDAAVVDRIAEARAHAERGQVVRNLEQAAAADEVREYFLHDRRGVRVGDVAAVLHAVADRRVGVGTALSRALGHAAPHFFGEIDRVVFVHGLDHGFDDDGHFVVADRLGDRHDLDAQIAAQHGFVQDAVLARAGEAGKLPEQDHVERLGLYLGRADHAVEFRALVGRAAADTLVNEDVFIRHEDVMRAGVLADLDQLGGGGVLDLVVGGHADIGRADAQVWGGGGHGKASFLVEKWNICSV